MVATHEEVELRQSVELALAGVGTDHVAAIHQRSFAGATSYRIEIVTVELADGAVVEVLLKDFGRSKLPKDAIAARRERELRVYDTLLDGAALDTARFYGKSWDPRRARFWLLLEFVGGRPLRDCGFDKWLAAASWLGRLHGRFVDQRRRLSACDFLVRHDAGYFRQAADRARVAVSDVSETLTHRLAPVLERYDEVLPVLSREPHMLVHGSYRPQNVLVVDSARATRVCPIDWELAAFGSRTYDLAFLCDGFHPPQLDALLDAYEGEAESSGAFVRDRAALRREVDCFRLHKLVNSLGHLQQWSDPLRTTAEVVSAAEELAADLGSGTR
jgi:aminoglycoside phosphotransferase (APT) family kinase protein